MPLLPLHLHGGCVQTVLDWLLPHIFLWIVYTTGRSQGRQAKPNQMNHLFIHTSTTTVHVKMSSFFIIIVPEEWYEYDYWSKEIMTHYLTEMKDGSWGLLVQTDCDTMISSSLGHRHS